MTTTNILNKDKLYTEAFRFFFSSIEYIAISVSLLNVQTRCFPLWENEQMFASFREHPINTRVKQPLEMQRLNSKLTHKYQYGNVMCIILFFLVLFSSFFYFALYTLIPHNNKCTLLNSVVMSSLLQPIYRYIAIKLDKQQPIPMSYDIFALLFLGLWFHGHRLTRKINRFL